MRVPRWCRGGGPAPWGWGDDQADRRGFRDL